MNTFGESDGKESFMCFIKIDKFNKVLRACVCLSMFLINSINFLRIRISKKVLKTNTWSSYISFHNRLVTITDWWLSCVPHCVPLSISTACLPLWKSPRITVGNHNADYSIEFVEFLHTIVHLRYENNTNNNNKNWCRCHRLRNIHLSQNKISLDKMTAQWIHMLKYHHRNQVRFRSSIGIIVYLC